MKLNKNSSGNGNCPVSHSGHVPSIFNLCLYLAVADDVEVMPAAVHDSGSRGQLQCQSPRAVIHTQHRNSIF